MQPFLSICIPASGRLDYVRNTLRSIYYHVDCGLVSLSDFEVILSDNDKSNQLRVLTKEFEYDNFHYFSSDCDGFMNSFFSLNYGQGKFLKLHNSQEIFTEGALLSIIKLIENYQYTKPLLFFTSGFLWKGNILTYNNFNDFIFNTSYFSSWSNAFGIWREDFLLVKNDVVLNELFPHTSILFTQTYKKDFVVNDMPLFDTQFVSKRGGHNKFKAFTIDYPSLLNTLNLNKFINDHTYKFVMKKLEEEYLPLLFFNVKILKRECFESDGFKENLKVYYSKGAYFKIFVLSFLIPFKAIVRRFRIKFLVK